MAACPRCGSRSISLVINPLTWPVNLVTDLRASKCPRCGWRGWKHKNEWSHIRFAGIFRGGTGHTGTPRAHTHHEHGEHHERSAHHSRTDVDVRTSDLENHSRSDLQPAEAAPPAPEPDLSEIDRVLAADDARRVEARREAEARQAERTSRRNSTQARRDKVAGDQPLSRSSRDDGTRSDRDPNGTSHRSSSRTSRRHHRSSRRRTSRNQVMLVVAAVAVVVSLMVLKQACFPASTETESVGSSQ